MTPINSFCSRLLLVSMSLVLLACGGGGGGGGSGGGGGGGGNNATTSVSLSTSKLDFDLSPDSFYRENITVTFKGDGLIIGYPPAVPEPGWLSVATMGDSSPVQVQLTANASGLAAGNYSTTLRFVTGLEDGTKLVYKDLAVNLKVGEGLSFGTPSLSFVATEGGTVPAGKNVTLNAGTAPAGWKLAVSYNSGGSDWLTLGETSGTMNSTSHTVTVTPKVMARGSYTANIELRDDKNRLHNTLPVKYDVGVPVTLDGSAEKTITEAASTADLSWDMSLVPLSGVDTTKIWEVTTDVDWVTITPSKGSLASLKKLTLSLSPTKLMEMDNGNHVAHLRLTPADPAIAPLSAPIQLKLNLQPSLGLTGQTNFSVFQTSTASDLSKSLQVSTNLGSAFATQINWEATEANNWLKITKASGNTGSNNTLTLQVDTAVLATMANGRHSALMTLKANHARFQNVLVPVNLSMLLAKVDHVAPYVAFRNQPSTIVVRGSGFAAQGNLQLTLGNTLVDAQVISDTELKVNLPAMSATGRLKAQVANGLNLDRSTAEVVMQNVPAYTRTRVELDKGFRSMTLDAERSAVLLGGGGHEIRRLTFGGAGWTEDKYEALYASKAALSVDGKELLVAISSTLINDSIHHLNASTLALNKTQLFSNDFYESYDLILPFNDGKIMLIDSDQWPEGLFYPSQESFYSPSGHYTNAVLSRDRSRALLGGTNSSSDTYSYDVSNGEFIKRSLVMEFFRNQYVSMSSDAGRLVASSNVYDKDFNLLGSLTPIMANEQVAITPDGRTVFAYGYDSNSELVFRRHDLNTASGPYPAATPNPDFAIEDGDYPVAMVVTDDGAALLVLAISFEAGRYDPSGSALYVFPIP